MDPFSHALIGATCSAAASNKETFKKASFIGAVSAMLPDLDVFLMDSSDPLFNVEIHRQFTHSFVFIPFGALITAFLFYGVYRKNLTFSKIYVYSVLGFATAGLSDSLTSYGTQLLWPFSETRFAWSIISVFDPIFTVGLLIGLFFSVKYTSKKGLIFIGLWMVLIFSYGVFQQFRAKTEMQNLISKRGHQTEKWVIKPTLANQILWGTRYIANDSVFADAVRVTLFSTKVNEGESAKLFKPETQFNSVHLSMIYQDIQRFSTLSDGFLTQFEQNKQQIGDARYAMLPTSLIPLWYIQFDTLDPSRHVDFVTERNTSKQTRDVLINLLLGQEIQQK